MIELDFGILLFITSIIGSASGIIILKKLVKKYNRASIIVILLAGVLLISMLIIIGYGIWDIADKEDKGTMEYGFKDAC